MPDRQTGELTAQEAKACVYRAQGESYSEAVRLAFPRGPTTTKGQNEKGSRVFARAQVQARVRELLAAAKVQDLCSLGRWGQMVMDGIERAWESQNMTAYFNGTRQLGQALGALTDTVSMTIEGRTDDLVLLEKLAGNDLAKLAALQAVLGAKDTFDVEVVTPSVAQYDKSTITH